MSLMWFITAAVVAAARTPAGRVYSDSAPGWVQCTECTKCFYARRYAMSDYAMVALCLCVCSSQVAAEPITVVCKAARVYVPIIGGVVWTFYRVLCKNGWTDRRQSLKPTPIHAKCRLGGRKLLDQNQLDSLSCFSGTPTCDRRTQSHGIYSDIITSRGQKDWRFSPEVCLRTHTLTHTDRHTCAFHNTLLPSRGGGRLQSNDLVIGVCAGDQVEFTVLPAWPAIVLKS